MQVQINEVIFNMKAGHEEINEDPSYIMRFAKNKLTITV